jgi:hypothetical protein
MKPTKDRWGEVRNIYDHPPKISLGKIYQALKPSANHGPCHAASALGTKSSSNLGRSDCRPEVETRQEEVSTMKNEE